MRKSPNLVATLPRVPSRAERNIEAQRNVERHIIQMKNFLSNCPWHHQLTLINLCAGFGHLVRYIRTTSSSLEISARFPSQSSRHYYLGKSWVNLLSPGSRTTINNKHILTPIPASSLVKTASPISFLHPIAFHFQ